MGTSTRGPEERLWLHFSRLSETNSDDLVVIERGEGAYVWDTKGRRYLDGLAGLFVVQAGHGRREIAAAATRQAERLAYFPLWSYAHPRAVELAERVVGMAPEGLTRVFFTSGGSQAVESAWKLGLLVSDEVICAFGRLGDWFGAGRLGYRPDLLTFAKGITSGYAPLGGVLVSERLAEPFAEGTTSFLHGITFGGHPVSCAVALANLDVMEAEDLPGRVRAHEADFRGALETLLDLPIVTEVRGMGYFLAVDLTNDGGPFTADQREWLVRRFLPKRLLTLGLHCRVDDRLEPVVQLSPPLVAGAAEFELITDLLRRALTDAWEALPAPA